MDADVNLPCPYLMSDPPRSSGRALLSRLLWEYCCLQWGLSPEEVARALSTIRAEGRRAEVEREQVGMAVRLIGGVLADGGVRSYARPVGGGEPVEMSPALWEVDDFRPRFATSALDAKRPFDPTAAPTHWIFVNAGDGDRVLEASCADVRAPVATSRPSRGEDPAGDAPAAIPMVRSGERLVRLSEVKSRTGMERSTIYARIKSGRFPKQVPTGGGMAVWRESELERWLADPT